MTVISLNVWGGKLFAPLMDFIRAAAPDTDVFCFQEMMNTDRSITESRGARVNLLAEITRALPGYGSFFVSMRDRCDIEGVVDLDISFGVAIFYRRELQPISHGSALTEPDPREADEANFVTMTPGGFLYATFPYGGRTLTVATVHGLSHPYTKLDTEERLEQSRTILSTFHRIGGSTLLCGDFNLRPETASIRMLGKTMVDLVKEYGVAATRTNLFPFHKENPFADYAFVSPDLRVSEFEVLDNIVSDHFPLRIEIP